LFVELARESCGQGDDRPTTDAPDHGYAEAIDEPKIGCAMQAELPGKVGGDILEALRGCQRLKDHAIEMDDAPERDGCAEADAGDPNDRDRGERFAGMAAEETGC
jgi:hypothetical protein